MNESNEADDETRRIFLSIPEPQIEKGKVKNFRFPDSQMKYSQFTNFRNRNALVPQGNKFGQDYEKHLSIQYFFSSFFGI